MKVTALEIEGAKLIIPQVFSDSRGSFMESYNKEAFKAIDITTDFVQDNHSISSKGVLRGLHLQKQPFAQGKLVRVVKGSVMDVIVDVNPLSKSFGKHVKVKLSAENNYMLWVPPTCAHGFLALEEQTIFQYKCTNSYHKDSEMCIKWDDKHLAIDWGEKNPLVSEKDKLGENFLDINFQEH